MGRSPTPARDVGEVVLPEVRPGEPDRPFAFRATPGHLLYVYFGYASCPDVCPTTLSDLHKALELLGADAARVEVAFVTVDLNRDSAQILVPYLASFVRGGHALRAPNQEQLGHAEAAFAATSTVTKSLQGEIQVSHTALSYLVDERGRIVDQWDFLTKLVQSPCSLQGRLPGHLWQPGVRAGGWQLRGRLGDCHGATHIG